jgi:UDP-N-acetylmuramate dehydrogenase
MTEFSPQACVPLADMTTIGVGGAAEWWVSVANVEGAQEAGAWAAQRAVPVTVIGGGSNLVVSDRGVPGLVVQMAIGGTRCDWAGDALHVLAGAGVGWDALVAEVVALGAWGMECLSGIPGSVGATPLQNVGAYGQTISQTLVSVDAVDVSSGERKVFTARECDLGYRTSRFRERDRDRYMIVSARYVLGRVAASEHYPDVQRGLAALGVDEPGPADIRAIVLAIRRSKGMVVDQLDPDSRSVGSFFVNPVLDRRTAEQLGRIAGGADPVMFPSGSGMLKVPAAWLIERTGACKGLIAGRVGLSSKHTLAIVNRGGATADDVVALAVQIKQRVLDQFGIALRPEPRFLGFDEDERMKFLLGEAS